MTKAEKYIEQSLKECCSAEDFEARKLVVSEFNELYNKKLQSMDESAALRSAVNEFGGVYAKFKKIKEEIVLKKAKRKKFLRIFNFTVLTIGLVADAVAFNISQDVFWAIIPIVAAIVIIQAVQVGFKIYDRKKLKNFSKPYSSAKTYVNISEGDGLFGGEIAEDEIAPEITPQAEEAAEEKGLSGSLNVDEKNNSSEEILFGGEEKDKKTVD